MPIGLIILLAYEAVYRSARKVNRRRAKRGDYTDLPCDDMGRPMDHTTGRRLSRNEARATAAHQRELVAMRTREGEWRRKGNTLPKYQEDPAGGAAGKADEEEAVLRGVDGYELERSRWSWTGAPVYTERTRDGVEIVNAARLRPVSECVNATTIAAR